jgi:hypothetical protein
MLNSLNSMKKIILSFFYALKTINIYIFEIFKSFKNLKSLSIKVELTVTEARLSRRSLYIISDPVPPGNGSEGPHECGCCSAAGTVPRLSNRSWRPADPWPTCADAGLLPRVRGPCDELHRCQRASRSELSWPMLPGRGTRVCVVEWRPDVSGRAASRVRVRGPGLIGCETGGIVVRAKSVAEASSCVSEAQVRAGRPGLVGCASGCDGVKVGLIRADKRAYGLRRSSGAV